VCEHTPGLVPENSDLLIALEQSVDVHDSSPQNDTQFLSSGKFFSLCVEDKTTGTFTAISLLSLLFCSYW